MVSYVFLALASSVLYSISAVLCKYGLQNNAGVARNSVKKLFLFLIQNRIWILGVLLGGVANIAVVEIQSRLDISIVYSILNFSYILVLVLGHYFLHERLNGTQWFGVGMAIVGTFMIVAIENPVTGRQTNMQSLINLTALSVIAVSGLIIVPAKLRKLNYEVLYAISAGVCFGCVEIYLKATTNYVTSEIGYFSIFSLTSLVQFVSLWPFFVMFIYGAIGWIFLQITYSHGSISITIPVIAVTQRIVSMSSGYYIFGEYFSFLRVSGILTILLGVLTLIFSTVKSNRKIAV